MTRPPSRAFTRYRIARIGDEAVTRIEAARPLDPISNALTEAVAEPFRMMGTRGVKLRNVLHGTPYGHSLHPMLVTLPIGAWTASVLFDLLGGAAPEREGRYEAAADLSIQAGCLGAVGAVVTGLTDWHRTHGEPQRLGLVHGLTTTTALGLFLSSLAMRRKGRRRPAKAVSAAGLATLFAGGYLGGHLVHRRNVSTDHADHNPAPRRFTRAMPVEDLPEGAPQLAVVDGVRVAVVRHRGRIHALGDRCAHFGGPLSEGWVHEGGLVCPWHGSRYCLDSGRPLDGPTTAPQPRFEVRVRDGWVELRKPGARRDQEDPPPPPGPDAWDPAKDPARPPRAQEVLFAHHQMIRGLFDRLQATHPDAPERLELLDELAGELDMHEKIEHAVFYPAVRPVYDGVPIAGAEHRHLTDLLAVTLTLDPTTERFERNLTSLRAAVEHHAGSEERDMFVQALRLGDGELRRLGRDLERKLTELRMSRLHTLVRLGRQALLQRGQGRVARAMADPALVGQHRSPPE